MNRVTFAGTAVSTTALGFGTAAMLGRIGERDSLRLLEAAYDAGVRHFDTAPAYGFGKAEALVGRFARGHADVTVATKAGLVFEGQGSPLLGLAKRLARPVLAAVPGLGARVGRAVRSATPPRAEFGVDIVRASIERSLRELGRDAIDVLLLHEAREADLANGELLAYLEAAVARGDVRTFGLGTDPATIAYAAAHAPGYARVLQFESNTARPNAATLGVAAPGRTIVTHTPFGGVGSAVAGAPGDNLRAAMQANPGGIVLFSSSSAKNIAANAAIAEAAAAGGAA